MATEQANSRWDISSSEMNDFQNFKATYNSQLEAMLYGTSFQTSQLEVNTISAYGINDQSFIMRFDQVMSHLQNTLRGSPEIRALAADNASLSNSIENMNQNGAIDEHMISTLQRLSTANIENPLLAAQINAGHTLIAGYDSLPQNLQAKIETSQLLYNNSDRETQAVTLVSLLEDELGVSQSATTRNIDAYTSTALAQRLFEMKTQHSAEDTENFDPLKFDDRAINFLERVMQRQMAENGVNEENVNQFRLHMLSLRIANNYDSAESSSTRELGDTMLLLDAMRYADSGRLPSGYTVDKPDVQTEWSQNSDPYNISFFSDAVYTQVRSNSIRVGNVLAIDGREGNAWRNEIRDEAIERLRNKAENWTNDDFNDNQRAVNHLISKLNNYGNGNRDARITREELGIIATEMMSIQAERQGLNDNQIDAAIRNNQFAVSGIDIYLIDEGMGTSQEILDLNDQRAAEGDLVAIGIQREQNVETALLMAKSYYRPNLQEYHADKWSARFTEDGTQSPAPYQEYIEHRNGRAEYEQRLRETIGNQARENYEEAPSARPPEATDTRASVEPTSQFQNVAGKEEDDPALVAAVDITGNAVIIGELPPIGSTDLTGPAVTQTANAG